MVEVDVVSEGCVVIDRLIVGVVSGNVVVSWLAVTRGGVVVVARTVVVKVDVCEPGHSTATSCPSRIFPSKVVESISSSAQASSMRVDAASSPWTQLAEHWFPNMKSDTEQAEMGVE